MILLYWLAACAPHSEVWHHGDPAGRTVSPKLVPFGSCEELRGALADSFVEQVVQARYGYGWGVWGAEDDAAGDGASERPSDYSTTNVQEAGVDEPDIVKTDGDYLYVVQQGVPELTVVDAWPPESSAVVGRVALAGSPYAAFLRGDTVVVFQYVWDEGATETYVRDGYGTRVTFVDVADRARPAITREIDVEGWLASARLVDGDAYLVTNHWIDAPEEVWSLAWDETIGLPEADWEASEEEQAALREEARAILAPIVAGIVADMDLADVLPNWWEDAVDAPLVECTDVYHAPGVAQPGLLTVSHLDLDAPASTTPSATGLFAAGWTVYASEVSLYVSQTSWWWTWGWGDDPLETHVHRFALHGAQTSYVSSGEVPGWMWSQFALDEQDGYLRVATTAEDWWGGSETGGEGSGVYVLAEQGDTMHVVGSVEGIAPGEMIYGVRFLEDMAWLVTYEQIDPLWAIDLGDPTDPKVVGELEIPGFSSYLHPVGDGYLLTVGMAGTDDGAITGFSVKLFDVRDPTAPVLLDEATVSTDDGSWSEALWDHHAFTFHNGVLAVPIYTWDYDGVDWTGFSGLWALSVDTTTGLTELGRVDHANLVAESDCLWDAGTGPCPESWWYASMRRSVVMEDKLYSISDYGVKVNQLRTPEEKVASVLFWPLEE
ncbi:MAG: beta-propeller domain-containing protein [Myxococcota bacterium]